MSSWLRQAAEEKWREKTIFDQGVVNELEQFGLRVLAEVERQVTIEQKCVDGTSDPAWNAYEGALTIVRSLRESHE